MKSIADLARVVAIVCVVIALVLLKVARFIWVHRKQIAAATYAAGCLCRDELEAISARAAQLVHAEPLQGLQAVAPILAPLAALREALERYLAARVYPAVAG